MLQALKQRWLLAVILLLFILCKLPQLHYPFYWDESWPYAPSLRAMYHHGVSLLPGAIDPELSRGHPLLFHALAAAWMKIFGTSHIAMHSFALLISTLLLIIIYEAGLRLFNKRVAVIALLLMALQTIFYTESTFLLPEVLVALLCLLSLYFYVRDQYAATAISLAALFLTKESGMVLGLVLGIDALIQLFDNGKPLRSRLYALSAIMLPTLLIAAFFLIQKHTRGWYFYPFHLQILEFNWPAFWYKFRMTSVRISFYDNYNFWYFVLLLILLLTAAIKNRKWAYAAVMLPAFCIYYFVDDKRAGRLLPSVPFFIVFILSVCFFLYVASRKQWFPRLYQRRFIILSGAFIVCYFCFCTINFFTARYLLAAFALLMLFTAAFMDKAINAIHTRLYYPVMGCIAIIGCCAFRYADPYGTSELGAYDVMDVQQATVDFFEQHIDNDKAIGCNFLQQQHLSDPATGFLHGIKVFKNLHSLSDTTASYLVFDTIEPGNNYNIIKNGSSYRLMYRTEKGKIWAEIYERKQ